MLLGWGTRFFIVHKGSWYELYDESGKKYKTFPDHTGTFVSISGDIFILRKGSWLETYDMLGRKINTRPIR